MYVQCKGMNFEDKEKDLQPYPGYFRQPNKPLSLLSSWAFHPVIHISLFHSLIAYCFVLER